MNLLRLITPPIFLLLFQKFKALLKSPKVDSDLLKEIKKSEYLLNIHKDKRVFIIGTGKSIKEQNLTILKDEIVIGLNEFYLHPEIANINPTYYLFSGFNLHPNLDKIETWTNWYQRFFDSANMHHVIPLINTIDYSLLKQLGFSNASKKTTFVNCINNVLKDIERLGFKKISQSYAGQSVSVMAISLAIMMGAKEICLLGLDHDWILSYQAGRQNHFYEDKESDIYKERNVHQKVDPLIEYWKSYTLLFEQYIALKNYADKNQIKITNYTNGGLLDIFERKSLLTYKS